MVTDLTLGREVFLKHTDPRLANFIVVLLGLAVGFALGHVKFSFLKKIVPQPISFRILTCQSFVTGQLGSRVTHDRRNIISHILYCAHCT